MSSNQSKFDKSQYRKPGRSRNSSGTYQRSYISKNSGSAGGGSGPLPPVSSHRSFKKTNNVQGGQSAVNLQPTAPSEQQHTFEYNGISEQPLTHGSAVPAVTTERSSRANYESSSSEGSNRAVTKSPSSQSAVMSAGVKSPTTPVKEEVSKPIAVQFGSLSPGFLNGMQIPARTSSAPPNLDEQKRNQALIGSSRAVPVPLSAVPKQQLPEKEARISKHVHGADPHSVSRVKTEPQVSSAPSTSLPQKPPAIPMSGSYPSPGRHTGGGSRSDRHGAAVDDDKWNKVQGHFVHNRDHVNNAGGFKPVQGGNSGMLRNPHQAPGQFRGVNHFGPLHSINAMHRNHTEADRWQCGSNFQKGLIASSWTLMHKAEKKYEVGKVDDEEQTKQRRLRGILNKLTPQNFEKLFEQVKDLNIDSAITLAGVISQIFDKALMEPIFCEMYADFCYHLSGELPDFSEENEKITFKRVLLNKCQEEFERKEIEQEEANRSEDSVVTQTKEEREERRVLARRRMLGNIRFIGELFKKKMLTERIMHECIKKLLGQQQNPDEEDIEALCKLMSTIGEMIDHPVAKRFMDAYFEAMGKLSVDMNLSSRVRFMLKDATDLRKNNWQQRRKVEGPKKIEEVHRDAAEERQAQANRLAHGLGINASGRRGSPSEFGSRGSNAMSSPNSHSGNRGYSYHLGGLGNQGIRSEDRDRHSSFESRTLSVPLRTVRDNSLTLGPQGGLARGMSNRGSSSLSSAPIERSTTQFWRIKENRNGAQR